MWGYVDFYTYFTLKEGTSIESIKKKVPDFLKRHKTDNGYAIGFEKLNDAYLHSKAGRQPGATGSLSNVYIFSSVAMFILIIACINFINLSTARSLERAKEVGVRKVLGAQVSGLVRQFLSESVLLSLVAAIIALILARLALPMIAQLSGKTFTSTDFFSWKLLAFVLLFGIVIGLLSGIYPALFLSRFRTILVLKATKYSGSGGVSLRKALVIFQFTLSMVLIAGTGIVYSQLNHLRSHDLGFRQDQMVIIDFGGDQQVQQKITTIKDVLRKHPKVLSVSASRAVPGEFLPNAYTEIQSPDGQMMGNGPLIYEIDEDFIPDYRIQVVAGRTYSREFKADTMKSMVINEAAARMFGYGNPKEIIGKKFSQWGRDGNIIGVVKDFNFRSLHQQVEPLTLRFAESYALNRISVRVKPENIHQTIAELKKLWDGLAPQRPFIYSFLDESFSKQYDADLHFGQVFTLFSGLAIFIACLGLFGLATFTAEQRTKEIGIRKVLGSSVSGIVTLISKDFIRLVLISIVIAVPLCWYAMNQWLNDFPYRISISPLIFLKSGLIAILIAVLTISWQSVTAAIANPVDSLRDE
jgi:putative ABC transport system permease protein